MSRALHAAGVTCRDACCLRLCAGACTLTSAGARTSIIPCVRQGVVGAAPLSLWRPLVGTGAGAVDPLPPSLRGAARYELHQLLIRCIAAHKCVLTWGQQQRPTLYPCLGNKHEMLHAWVSTMLARRYQYATRCPKGPACVNAPVHCSAIKVAMLHMCCVAVAYSMPAAHAGQTGPRLFTALNDKRSDQI